MQMAARKSGAITEMIACLNKKEFPYLQKHAAGALANIVAEDGTDLFLDCTMTFFHLL